MVSPLTLKPKRKAEDFTRDPPTIVLSHEEDDVLRKCPKPLYRSARYILETKTKVGSTTGKDPDPRTNPNIDEEPTTPKSHTHPPHECDGRVRDPEVTAVPLTPKSTRKGEVLARTPPTMTSSRMIVVYYKSIK